MTHETETDWLLQFAASAERTDRFAGRTDHRDLLAAGLFGEAGSVIAELKKERRERDAYPVYRHRMLEEVGDFLWYYVRLVSVIHVHLLDGLGASTSPSDDGGGSAAPLTLFLRFGAAVGNVLAAVGTGAAEPSADLPSYLQRVWSLLAAVARETGVDLRHAAENNSKKTANRWPTQRVYVGPFDDGCLEDEQLPRRLEIEFRERSVGKKKTVVLRCNGINFGDRVTDNIADADSYRYHDVFHFAHAVHLGWSPVVRALLRCKRKSSPEVDEAQDGARAAILEEAVAAIVFSRAKQLQFFAGMDHVDFDLLKTVSEFVQGYEVERVPYWQWEIAILDGYRVFRELCSHAGGRLTLDLSRRQLTFAANGNVLVNLHDQIGVE